MRCVGGEQALQERLVSPEPPESLAMVGDDRYLSVMSRRIFRAGLKHSMVDARWPAFEQAFGGFDVDTVAAMDDAAIAQLQKNERLIRHAKKLLAVRDNARVMQRLLDQGGSFGVWLADWPQDDIVALWHTLQKRFSQLGGQSAPAFLRMVGKDTFLITPWVAGALSHWGLHDGATTGRSAQRQIGRMFNSLAQATELPLCQLSQILALSIDTLNKQSN